MAMFLLFPWASRASRNGIWLSQVSIAAACTRAYASSLDIPLLTSSSRTPEEYSRPFVRSMFARIRAASTTSPSTSPVVRCTR